MWICCILFALGIVVALVFAVVNIVERAFFRSERSEGVVVSVVLLFVCILGFIWSVRYHPAYPPGRTDPVRVGVKGRVAAADSAAANRPLKLVREDLRKGERGVRAILERLRTVGREVDRLDDAPRTPRKKDR